MRAIVQDRYGDVDVVGLRDIQNPFAKTTRCARQGTRSRCFRISRPGVPISPEDYDRAVAVASLRGDGSAGWQSLRKWNSPS